MKKKDCKEVTHSELRKISINALEYLRELCEENNLQYFLAYGTLLGAVRHKGYIPWDDDIDVWMPRKDYNRLIEIAKDLNDEEWEIMAYQLNDQYLFPWAKVCHKKTVVYPSRFHTGLLYGVSIDIFPLDGVLENDIFEKKRVRYLKQFYRTFPYTGGVREGIGNRIKYCVKKIWYEVVKLIKGNPIVQLKKVDSLVNVDWENVQNVTCIYAVNGKVWKKEWFEPSNICLKFEEKNYTVPRDYDSVLKIYYGDYMQLPPENERKSNHSYKAYYKG